MNSILVPVDFSQASRDAFHYAVRIGAMFHSRVTLLHVLSAPVNPQGFSGFNMPEFKDPAEIEEAMRSYEDEIPPEIASRIEVVHRIALGSPVKEIGHFTAQYEVELMVMGMKAEKNRKHFLMGSIVSQVLSKSDLPILVIPEGTVYKQISQIVYATDFQNDELKAIDALLDFAFLYDATIHCLHIEKEDSPSSEQLERRALFKAKYREDVLLHHLKFVEEENKDLVKGVLEYCKQNEIEMLAMLSINRNVWTRLFRQDVSRKLALKTAVPLLIFDTND